MTWRGGGWQVTPAAAGLVVERWVPLGVTKNMQARGVSHGAWMPHAVVYDVAGLTALGVDLAALEEESTP
jgi:hypothetical protein